MKKDEVILVGAGGHALSLAEFAAERIRGYLGGSPNSEMPGEYMGTDEALFPLLEQGFPFHIAFIYSGLPRMERRRQLIEIYERAGARFATLIAPSAIVTPRSAIGQGAAIMTGAIINRAKIGNHVVVNSGAIVEHDCSIGDNTFIGPGAVIGGFTAIGKNCFIGLGARIANGLHITDNITVAMGATVTRNLTEPGIYHGPSLKLFVPKS
ncbi:MAG: hypothetical protein J1D77_02245 [Muribaculaceae bacterium]|nr:hypothetical protein [Muribaculaceae bacterium]